MPAKPPPERSEAMRAELAASMASASDAPVQYPAGWPERLASFIGAVARPLSILIACSCAGAASIILATKVRDGNDGYLLAGAIWLGAGSLFIGKAVEVFQNHRASAKANAEVRVAEVTAHSPEMK